MTAPTIHSFGHGFHHIRGSFRIGGVVDVGTQCSLVEMGAGRWVFLDSYTLTRAVLEEVLRLTDGGAKVSAILNLHPYHTVHCEWMHRTFPRARLFGTARHREKLPHLPWEAEGCEGEVLAREFGSALQFSVPRGVDFICENDRVHFASVLAFHPGSGTIHVDDTLSAIRLPGPLGRLPQSGRIDFHPTLRLALRREAGAADAFRDWVFELGADWHAARRLAAAHNIVVELRQDFPEQLGAALGRVTRLLDKHRSRWG
jgi:hypothetical protein